MQGALAAPQRGGNAIDAAIATAFAQGVADPQMSSVGGNGVLQVYHAPSGEHLVLEFYGRAPLKATPDLFASRVKGYLRFGLWELEGRVNQVGHLSVTTPGTVLGLWELHRRFGTLPWDALLQPAIALARDGFPVPGELHALWVREPYIPGTASTLEVLNATPASRRLFTRDGAAIRPGEVFRNPDYARTLERIAREGPDVLYKGDIAHQIAEDFARNGGLLSYEDLATYRVRVKQPVRGTYRGYEVAGVPAPGSGLQIVETLNILEGFNVGALGFPSADYLDLLARAQLAGFADRMRYLGDPEFAEVPEAMLASKEHARGWQERIRRGEPIQVGAPQPEPAHTTTVSAMDEEGNAVAITHTLGTPASGVVVEGLGFMFNNSMHSFHPYPGHPNSIAPGKARTTGMSPTIVFRDGRPCIVTSAPGATKILTANLQVIVNLVDHGMTAVEAVAAPRLHAESWVDLEARLAYAFGAELERRGHRVVKSTYSYDPFFGLAHAVVRDPATGRLVPAADPRGRGGTAVWRG